MPICYHRDAFILGAVVALLVVNVTTLFEGIFKDWVIKVRNLFFH